MFPTQLPYYKAAYTNQNQLDMLRSHPIGTCLLPYKKSFHYWPIGLGDFIFRYSKIFENCIMIFPCSIKGIFNCLFLFFLLLTTTQKYLYPSGSVNHESPHSNIREPKPNIIVQLWVILLHQGAQTQYHHVNNSGYFFHCCIISAFFQRYSQTLSTVFFCLQ